MNLGERWYWCLIREDPGEEPDWSRVPADRREPVRLRWHRSQRESAERWRLWGPQVALYDARPDLLVEVEAPAAPSARRHWRSKEEDLQDALRGGSVPLRAAVPTHTVAGGTSPRTAPEVDT